MKIFFRKLCFLAAVFVLLLPAAAQARTIISTDQLLQLCGRAVFEDITLEGIFDLTGQEWTPISEVAEGVTIDGTNATIIGLDMSATYYNGQYYYSGFAAQNYGTITGLSIRLDSSAVTTASYAGPVAGIIGINGTVENCTVYGSADDGVVITSDHQHGMLGGIAGYVSGAVTNCTVNGLTITDTSGSNMGGIAGSCHGTVFGCYAGRISVVGTHKWASLGGIAGFAAGNMDSPAFVESNTVAYSSISGKAGRMGGIISVAQNAHVTGNRANYVDIIHQDPDNVVCTLGGIAGVVQETDEIEPSYFNGNYYAQGLTGAGIEWQANDIAGGIVGQFQGRDDDLCYMNCFFCTDFCSAPLYGELTGYASDASFERCDGVSKRVMTASGWAQDNLGREWQNSGPEGYPVLDNRVPVTFSRVHKGDLYLPINGVRIFWNGQDVANLGMVEPDTRFDPVDFSLLLSGYPGVSIATKTFTVNGAPLTSAIKAGNYSSIDFSAEVYNLFVENTLLPCIEKGEKIYQNGLHYYSADTLIALRRALDEAIEACSNDYFNITDDRGRELCDAIEDVENQKFLFTVTLTGTNCATYVNGEGASSFTGAMGETFRAFAFVSRGYRFLYWKDSAGNILSEDPEFYYTVSRNTEIEAVAVAPMAYTFTYKDNFGKIYKSEVVTDYREIAYPAQQGEGGMRAGYVVKEWTNDYPGTLPRHGEVKTNVTFTAHLMKDETTFSVRAEAAGSIKVSELKAAQVFRAAAPAEYNGDAFSYWADAVTGQAVCGSAGLAVSVYSDMSFVAVYGATSAPGTVVNLWTPIVSDGKISFPAQLVKGSSFGEEVMHGVLLLKSDGQVDELMFDTPGVIVGKSGGLSAKTGTFIINKTNVQPGETWYGRAFCVLKDGSGAEQTVFSDIKSAAMPGQQGSGGGEPTPFSMDDEPSLPPIGDGNE